MSPDDEKHVEIERAVLETVLRLHPDHLTTAELVLKLSADGVDGEDIRHAIRDLKCSGLLRLNGGLVVPTHAALCASALFPP